MQYQTATRRLSKYFKVVTSSGYFSLRVGRPGSSIGMFIQITSEKSLTSMHSAVLDRYSRALRRNTATSSISEEEQNGIIRSLTMQPVKRMGKSSTKSRSSGSSKKSEGSTGSR